MALPLILDGHPVHLRGENQFHPPGEPFLIFQNRSKPIPTCLLSVLIVFLVSNFGIVFLREDSIMGIICNQKFYLWSL